MAQPAAVTVSKLGRVWAGKDQKDQERQGTGMKMAEVEQHPAGTQPWGLRWPLWFMGPWIPHTIAQVSLVENGTVRGN